MKEVKTHNPIEKRYLAIRGTVEVLFVMGLIIELLFRRDILPIEYRVYALTPFIINMILIFIGVKYLYDLRTHEGHLKRVTNIIIKILINLVFITLVLFTLNKI